MFKVGDKVYSQKFGKGTVTSTNDDKYDGYKINVSFEGTYDRQFNDEGVFNTVFRHEEESIKILTPLDELL